MQKIEMEYDGGVKPVSSVSSKKKLAHRPAFVVTKETPKGQVSGANSFNEMRQCLLDNGLMESK